MARRRSRGFQRQVRRKFVWNRAIGASGIGTVGVDLLAPFRAQPGATHLGATVMRIRGYVVPSDAFGTAGAAGNIGMRIDSWNEDPADTDNQPILQPDEDWLAWLPWTTAANGGGNQLHVTWNQQASAWTVDIKSARKLEELNQTLWMFTDQPAGADRDLYYNLSIGLKLP